MEKELFELATKTVELLKKNKLTLSSAESCTGGMFSSLITAVGGSSDIFELGIVSYSSRIKNKILNVKNETLEAFGAVSRNTATEMAENVRKLSSSDIAVSVTGVAGPSMSEGKPVGLVYIALSTENYSKAEELHIPPNSRDFVRKTACIHMLNMICNYLKRNA